MESIDQVLKALLMERSRVFDKGINDILTLLVEENKKKK